MFLLEYALKISHRFIFYFIWFANNISIHHKALEVIVAAPNWCKSVKNSGISITLFEPLGPRVLGPIRFLTLEPWPKVHLRNSPFLQLISTQRTRISNIIKIIDLTLKQLYIFINGFEFMNVPLLEIFYDDTQFFKYWKIMDFRSCIFSDLNAPCMMSEPTVDKTKRLEPPININGSG